jgi:ATPase subunit of ABC transporter with duplicated ATPase domains
MRELPAGLTVRVLLAQALFGNPDILLLDEPTNNLDLPSIMWLEEFLCEFKNTVVVVSHDRHFLDKVCTHIADIDFGKISLYTGNYTFWYQASQLALKQRRDQNKKSEDKIKELKTFIERFSANASKSRQATSRKKLIAKLNIDEIKASTRKYPHLHFAEEREAGRDLLMVTGLAIEHEGRKIVRGLDLAMVKGEKIAFVSRDDAIPHALLKTLAGEAAPAIGGHARAGVSEPSRLGQCGAVVPWVAYRGTLRGHRAHGATSHYSQVNVYATSLGPASSSVQSKLTRTFFKPRCSNAKSTKPAATGPMQS